MATTQLEQDLTQFTPTIWSPIVNEFFKEKLVATSLFEDFSADVAAGGDKVRIPQISDSGTVSDVNTTSGVVDPSDASETSSVLNVNKWKAEAVRFSDFQLAQAARSYNIREKYARNKAHRVAREFEKDFYKEFDNLDTTIGDSATALTSTNLELAHEILDSTSVPKTDRFTVIHPRAYWGDVFKRQKYYDASQFGIANIPGGNVAELYGSPIISQELIQVTNGSLSNGVVHKEMIAYALGTPPEKENSVSAMNGTRLSLKDSPGGDLALKWTIDLMYGLVTQRSEAGVQVLAQNNR